MKKHRRSSKIKSDSIIQLNELTWQVKSTSSPSTTYEVAIVRGTVCNTTFCPMMCPECRICPHQASCTCTDYAIKANTCKHIHDALPPNVKKKTFCHNMNNNHQPLDDDLERIPWPSTAKQNNIMG